MHLLGFSDEHTRPDRDQYLTVDWPHTQVFMTIINSSVIFFTKQLAGVDFFWKSSWTLEDQRKATICDKKGASQETANFDHCVGNDIIDYYGVGYDFNSIMHSPLNR